MLAREKREWERQQQLRALEERYYQFEVELEGVDRCERCLLLLRAHLALIEQGTVEVNVYARFVTDEFLEPLKKFSRTPEELRFMQAKLVEFLVGNIVNGAACK